MISEKGAEEAFQGERELIERLRESLAALPGSFAGRGALLHAWELRSRLRVRAGASGEDLGTGGAGVDGGLRIERLERETGRPLGHRFVVGAPPGRDSGSWTEWVGTGRRLCEELMRRAARPLGMLRVEGEQPPQALGFVRLRAWRRDGEEPQARIEQGVRFARAGRRDGPARGPSYEWVGADPGRAPWLRDPAVLAGRHEPRLPPQARGARGAPHDGPVLLLPRAAARWVHEMAHAGLESPLPRVSRSVPGPGRIEDDPRAAPWPFGFDEDDHGDAAAPLALWGEGAAAGAEIGRGHRRRASIRDPALPSLSVTRLVPSRDTLELREVPAGTPVVIDAGAARFEPRTGTIVIDVSLDRGESEPAQRALLRVEIDQGWGGSRVVDSGVPSDGADDALLTSAVCTRLGQRHHVLVGAPTIVLDHVLL